MRVYFYSDCIYANSGRRSAESADFGASDKFFRFYMGWLPMEPMEPVEPVEMGFRWWSTKNPLYVFFSVM